MLDSFQFSVCNIGVLQVHWWEGRGVNSLFGGKSLAFFSGFHMGGLSSRVRIYLDA